MGPDAASRTGPPCRGTVCRLPRPPFLVTAGGVLSDPRRTPATAAGDTPQGPEIAASGTSGIRRLPPSLSVAGAIARAASARRPRLSAPPPVLATRRGAPSPPTGGPGGCSSPCNPSVPTSARSDSRSSQSPFWARSRPREIRRQSRPHPARVSASRVSSIPSSSNRIRAPATSRGTVQTRGGGLPSGAGGPISPCSASKAARAATRRAMSRACAWARTIPATEFTSAIASTGMSSSAARSTYSSGWDAPVRNVKLDMAQSSANMRP